MITALALLVVFGAGTTVAEANHLMVGDGFHRSDRVSEFRADHFRRDFRSHDDRKFERRFHFRDFDHDRRFDRRFHFKKFDHEKRFDHFDHFDHKDFKFHHDY